MIRVDHYTIFDNYDEFKNYWLDLPAQKNAGISDITDIKFSTISTIEEINGKPENVLNIDFPDENSQPIFNFSPELIESYDTDRGFKIVYDESTNSMLAFEFYEKSDSNDVLDILIGPYIGNHFFLYVGKLQNSRN